MKQLLLLIAVTLAVSGASTTTVVTAPDESLVGVTIYTLGCATETAHFVACPVCPAVTLSTGPVTMKSPIDGSCGQIDYLNPNSTCHATKWVPCPK